MRRLQDKDWGLGHPLRCSSCPQDYHLQIGVFGSRGRSSLSRSCASECSCLSLEVRSAVASCGRCAVVKALRFQVKGEDEEETDMVFVENKNYTRWGRSDSWRPSGWRLSSWKLVTSGNKKLSPICSTYRSLISEQVQYSGHWWGSAWPIQNQVSLSLVSTQKRKKEWQCQPTLPDAVGTHRFFSGLLVE